MMLVLSVLGFAGFLVLGISGLAPSGSELERILAIACLALAAAGFVGFAATAASGGAKARRPRPDPPFARPNVLGDIFSAIAIAPIAAVCVGVFLLTLVPAIYVMLPVFALWRLGSAADREHVPTPPHGAGLPAYA